MTTHCYPDEVELKNERLMAGITSDDLKKYNWPEYVREYLKGSFKRKIQARRTNNPQQENRS